MAIAPTQPVDGFRVRGLLAADVGDLHRFLASDPGTNAFLLGWLDVHGVGGPSESRFEFLAAWEHDGGLAAVALVAGGDICCVSHGAPRAGAALGQALELAGASLRTLAGPSSTVDQMLEWRIGLSETPTVLRQRVYVARTTDLLVERAPLLREAVDADIPDLVRAGRDMHLEEVGQPISQARDAVFCRSVEIKVSHGRTWVARDPYTDALMYKASVSAASRDVAQIEGVYVAPEYRRRGLARSCTAALGAALLARHDAVSLYVGLENHAARELYRQLGFRAASPYASVLFDG